jgi:hypothetical protein
VGGPRAATAGGRPKAVRPSAATRAASRVPGEQRPKSPPESGRELAETVVQAAGEIAQLGLELGGRALIRAVRRIPRP